MGDSGTPGDIAASIVEMQALLLGTETIEEFLAELAGLAVRTVGEGPCLHALRTGTLVSIEDLASDQRWAAYAETALQHGIRSSLSLPLSSSDTATPRAVRITSRN